MYHHPKSKIQNPKSNAGLTLIELLVAMAITLVMVYALILMFEVVGRGVAEGRANIQMSEQLRHVSNRLHDQLDGLTIQPRPWPEPASGSGYLTILEGPGSDTNPLRWLGSLHELEALEGVTGDTPRMLGDSIHGDVDDVVSFTVRTTGEPFIGQLYDPSIDDFRVITSNLAEIILFTRWDDRNNNGIPDPGEVTLYQRILLIRPDLNDPQQQGIVPGTFRPQGNILPHTGPPESYDPQQQISLEAFYQRNDLSVRPHFRNGNLIGFTANSLADLTKRENRFGHYAVNYDVNPPAFINPAALQNGLPAGFPFPLNRGFLVPRGTVLSPDPDAPVRPFGYYVSGVPENSDAVPPEALGIRGDDVLLTNVLAFDVRVYDPVAPIYSSGELEAVEPGDPGYPGQQLIGNGAFVDLNWANQTGSGYFSGPPPDPLSINPPRRRTIRPNDAGTTYCTWSFHYEYGGPGTDGFDSSGSFGVDSVDERRTAPPYPVPLRGLEIRLRIYDNSARQVRQTRVVANFVP